MTGQLSAPSVEMMLSIAVADARGQAGAPGHSVGVDVVDTSALARLLEKMGDRLARRLYTGAERQFCDGNTDRLASTLAGKEAVAKALGTGIRGGVRWTDIEISRAPAGRPFVRLHGRAAERAAALGLGGIALSLGHEGGVGFAVAIGIREEMTP